MKSNEHSFHGELHPSTFVTVFEAGQLLKRLLDDVKVCRIPTFCSHGFSHVHKLLMQILGTREFTESACVELLQMEHSALLQIASCFLRTQAPDSKRALRSKVSFATRSDVLRETPSWFDSLLRVGPVCRASGSSGAAAFGCLDAHADWGSQVPEYP